MLSILIPTYNYNVTKLCNTIHEQLLQEKNDFEILVYEDGSNNNLNNLDHLPYTKVISNSINVGRTKSRQCLANLAKYDWVLFLDADVIPKSNNFINSYIEHIKTDDFDAVFGGFKYHEKKPSFDFMLRWKYGKKKEEVPALKRNKNPYKVIISANFLIKKTIFKTLINKTNDNSYGYDNYFGMCLKQTNTKVKHIDNEVYHLGIERSHIYLKKKEEAALTLLKLHNENNLKPHDNDLLHSFQLLVKLRATKFVSFFFIIFKHLLIKNLTGKNPSIFLLQVYRLLFMCYSYNKS